MNPQLRNNIRKRVPIALTAVATVLLCPQSQASPAMSVRVCLTSWLLHTITNGQSVSAADLRRTLSAANGPMDQPIARNPEFLKWVNSEDVPYREEAIALANKLTLGQAQVISDEGGVHIFKGAQHCTHCCAGCLVKADEKPFETVTRERFTPRVKALVGLEKALAKGGHRLSLVNHEVILPFLDEDPMAVLLRGSDGVDWNAHDVATFLHRETRAKVTMVSSGWNPKALHSQEAAQAFVRDVVAGKADYLKSGIDFQIKAPSIGFRKDALEFVHKILREDQQFQKHYREDFTAYGFDFSKYRDWSGASKKYRALVVREMGQFIRTSKYMQERIENLKTLFPALQKSGAVRLYTNAGAPPSDSSFLSAFMTPEAVERMEKILREEYLDAAFGNGSGKTVRFNKAEWYFSGPSEAKSSVAKPGAPFLDLDGTIGFSGAVPEGFYRQGLPNLATHPNPHVRSFLDNPVLDLNGTIPPRKTAARRLDGTWHTDVSDRALSDIADRVEELARTESTARGTTTQGTQGAQATHDIRLSKQARYIKEAGKGRPTPVLDLIVDGNECIYNFSDDSLYDKSMRPFRFARN